MQPSSAHALFHAQTFQHGPTECRTTQTDAFHASPPEAPEHTGPATEGQERSPPLAQTGPGEESAPGPDRGQERSRPLGQTDPGEESAPGPVRCQERSRPLGQSGAKRGVSPWARGKERFGPWASLGPGEESQCTQRSAWGREGRVFGWVVLAPAYTYTPAYTCLKDPGKISPLLP